MTHPISDLPRLERLHRWLTLERWAGLMGIAGLWLFAGPLMVVLGLAALAFTPMLLWTLWALRRRGWVAGFVGTVGGTALTASTLSGPTSALAPGLTLLAFFVYTWVLKLCVAEWVREVTEAAEWRRTQARWGAEREAEIADLLGHPEPLPV